MLRIGASECGGDDREMIDLLCGMPCDAFDILGMFHEDPHALKVGVRLNWDLDERV